MFWVDSPLLDITQVTILLQSYNNVKVLSLSNLLLVPEISVALLTTHLTISVFTQKASVLKHRYDIPLISS